MELVQIFCAPACGRCDRSKTASNAPRRPGTNTRAEQDDSGDASWRSHLSLKPTVVDLGELQFPSPAARERQPRGTSAPHQFGGGGGRQRQAPSLRYAAVDAEHSLMDEPWMRGRSTSSAQARQPSRSKLVSHRPNPPFPDSSPKGEKQPHNLLASDGCLATSVTHVAPLMGASIFDDTLSERQRIRPNGAAGRSSKRGVSKPCAMPPPGAANATAVDRQRGRRCVAGHRYGRHARQGVLQALPRV